MQSDSMMDALNSAAIASNISNRAMQFSKQVTGSVKQTIKANRANAEEIRKVKDEIKIAKSEATSNENIIGGKASENQNVADSNLDKKINNNKSLSPQTGDNIVIWICLLITSCIGIIVTSKQILKK